MSQKFYTCRESPELGTRRSTQVDRISSASAYHTCQHYVLNFYDYRVFTQNSILHRWCCTKITSDRRIRLEADKGQTHREVPIWSPNRHETLQKRLCAPECNVAASTCICETCTNINPSIPDAEHYWGIHDKTPSGALYPRPEGRGFTAHLLRPAIEEARARTAWMNGS